MKKNRLIFFSVFGAYQLFVFLFTLYINRKQSDPLSLLPLLSHSWIFIYGAFAGLLLVGVDFGWSWVISRKRDRHEQEMILENNTLKAKIYDLQHDKKGITVSTAVKISMDVTRLISAELEQAAQVLNDFLNSPDTIACVASAAAAIGASMKSGGKVISCGNGGSQCDAMHFAEELTGRYRDDRKALPAICISDPSHLSCVSNDYGYEFVFSRYVEALGNKGDVLLAISTSGNSPNVLRAAHVAREKGMKVIALTGKDGGKLGPLADIEIRVAHAGYADRIQEVHIKVIHILILLIEKHMS